MIPPCEHLPGIPTATQSSDGPEEQTQRALQLLRWTSSLFLIITLVVAIAGCTQKQTFPPGAFCVLPQEYIKKQCLEQEYPATNLQGDHEERI